MPSPMTWAVAVCIVLLEAMLLAALGIENWCLQTGVCVTMFLGLERDFVPGALTLAALLFPIEWLVAGIPGYYAAGLVAAFLLLRIVRGNIPAGWGLPYFLVGVSVGLAHGLTMAAALLVADPSSPLLTAVLWQVVPASLLTGVGCILIGRLMARLDAAVAPRRTGLLQL